MLRKLLDDMSLTVTQLNEYVSSLLEADETLSALFVTGEISNFKRHSSGHCYFSLKDEKSTVRCVMFKGQASTLNFTPKDGMQVMVGGYASLYARDGSFQVYAQSMQEKGQGDLHKKYEQLKKELELLGYFESSRKKKIPFLPLRVGVVTSPTGAVIRDIIHVATRRNPKADILLYPARVQGEGAENEIAAGIAYFNAQNNVDVIIIARGGGSMEDLWAFNEKTTATAIFESEIPVISAIGHETDFTISDFVSDLRAPTPSAAAELAFPILQDLHATLQSHTNAAKLALRRPLVENRLRLDKIQASALFEKPKQMIVEYKSKIEHLDTKLYANYQRQFLQASHLWQTLSEKAIALSPQAILNRGYAYVVDSSTTENVASIVDATLGRRVNIILKDGSADATLSGQVAAREE